MDWDNEFSPQHPRLRPNLDKQTYVGIGWGPQLFLDTQNWSDLTPATRSTRCPAWTAPCCTWNTCRRRAKRRHRRILLTPEQYRRLTGYIRAAIARDGAGQAVWMQGYHYHEQDAFYLANGRYSH